MTIRGRTSRRVGAGSGFGLLLGLVAVLLATPARAEPADDSAREVLTKRDFGFCREQKTPPPLGGNDWCSIRDEASTCPQLKEQCSRAPDVGGLFGGSGGFFGGDSKVKTKVGEGDVETARNAPWEIPFNLSLPFGQVLLWVFVGLLVAVVAFFIIRAILERKRDELAPLEPEPEVAPGVVYVDPGLAETAALLAKARAEADTGRALAYLYAALLRHLEDARLIEWDIARTNREYVRTVRGKTPLDRPMAELVREVERAKFGHAAPTRSVFEGLYNRIAPHLARVAAVLLFALLSMSGTACNCGSTDLEGRAAFNEILQRQGIEQARFGRPLDTLDGDAPPVVVDSDWYPLEDNVLDALHDAMLGGARVLVLASTRGTLPSWPTVRLHDGAERVQTISDEDAEEMTLEEVLQQVEAKDIEAIAAPDGGTDAGTDGGTKEEVDPELAVTDGGTDGGVPPTVVAWPVTPTPAFSAESGIEPTTTGWLPRRTVMTLPPELLDKPEVLLERNGKPFVVRWKSERGVLVLVADRRLFSNGAMAVPANARLAMAVVRTVTGADNKLASATIGAADPAESPAESLERSGLWVLLLQALFALSIVFWSRGAAFGVLRDRSQLRRRAFSEHLVALGAQLARRGGARISASMYAGWALERLHQRMSREADRNDPAGLAKALALRLGDDEGKLRALLVAADEARRDPNGPADTPRDLDLIRRLGRLLAQLQAEQRRTS